MLGQPGNLPSGVCVSLGEAAGVVWVPIGSSVIVTYDSRRSGAQLVCLVVGGGQVRGSINVCIFVLVPACIES